MPHASHSHGRQTVARYGFRLMLADDDDDDDDQLVFGCGRCWSGFSRARLALSMSKR